MSRIRDRFVVVVCGVLALYGLHVVTSVDAEAGPPSGLTTPPLVLRTVSAPRQVIPAPAAGGFSHAYYNVDASGPFCFQGFRVGADIASNPTDFGQLTFELSRIDGVGMSHGSFELVDTSGGFSELDMAIAYGAQICAAGSLEFHATYRGPSSGTFVDYQLRGTAIVLAGSNVTVTITEGS